MAKQTGKWTNVFIGGLNSDVDPNAQPPNTYRNSINGRVVFNQSTGSLTWTTVTGNSVAFLLSANYGKTPTGYVPIGCAEFSDYIAILSCFNGHSEIGIARVNQFGIWSYITCYNDLYDPFGQLLNFSTAHDIQSIIANVETNAIQRIYWTDVYNEDRVFNMVEGLQANNPAFVNGDYQPLVSTGKYPPFYSAFSMDSSPDFSQGTIQFVKSVNGSKLSGVYQYCYRLVTKDGYKTPWTIPTHRVILTPDPVDSVNSQNYAMQASKLPTSKGVQIQINDIDSRYFQIEVVYIYSIVPSQSLNASIFATVNINGNTSLDFFDISNGGIPVALDTLLTTVTVSKTVQALAVRQKRMFKMGIEVGTLPNFDPEPVTIAPYMRRVQTDEVAISAQNIPFLSTSSYTNTTKIIKYLDSGSSPVYTTYQIIDDYVSYQGMQVEHLYGGHFRGETYRVGILFTDKKGFPLFVYHCGDIQLPEQYLNTYNVTILDGSGSVVVRDYTLGSVGDYKLTDNNRGHTSPDYPYIEDTAEPTNVRNQIMGLMLSNIDLTDIIDEIGGFAIVRVERDPTILGQGLIWNMVNEQSGADVGRIRPMGYPSNFFVNAGGVQYWTASNGNKIMGKDATKQYVSKPYTFTFDCPDYIFDQTTIPTLQKNYALKSVGGCYMTETGGGSNGYGYQDFGADNTANNGRAGLSDKSYYTDVTGFQDAFLNPVIFGRISSIQFQVNFGFDTSITGFNLTSDILEGFVHVQDDPGHSIPPLTDNRLYNGGIHNNALCMGTQGAGINPWYEMSMTRGSGGSFKAICYQLINYIIDNKTPYGGVSSETLSQSIYIPIGHFQPINDAVKAQILSGGRYVFNNVEVWGGDCFVDMYQYARIYAQNDLTNHSIAIGNVFPCEMKYNTLLRKGNTWAKSGFIAQAPYFQNGVSSTNMESELINDVILYSETNVIFSAVPLNYVPQSLFPNLIIYSPPKIDGESVDEWRVYPVNQFDDVEGIYGAIIGASTLFDAVYCIQERAFGRLRILDRTTLVENQTDPLTLGYGGVLDSIEYINTQYGTQSELSIVNTGKAIYFIDTIKRAVCRFSQNGFEILSDVHGLHNYMESILNNPIYNFRANNPSLQGGILGVFDRQNGEVLFSFVNDTALDSQALTLGFSEPMSAFSSFYSFIPTKYAQLGDFLLTFCDRNNFDTHFYLQNKGNIGQFYGTLYQSVLQFVCNPKSRSLQDGTGYETKIFGTQQISGDNFISLFTGLNMQTNYTSDSYNPSTDDRVKSREAVIWFPLRSKTATNRQRGLYLICTYTITNNGTFVSTVRAANTEFRLSRK